MAKRNYIGFIRGEGGTLIVQMRQSKDALSPELWQYYGQWELSKAKMREKRAAILEVMNRLYGQDFKRVVID